MRVKTLGEAFQDMEHGCYDFTIKGECSNCGNCCSNSLYLTQKEINTIKVYIKKHHIKEQIHRILPAVEQPVLDMTCPFLDNNAEKKCTIYPVRPLVCRRFICNDSSWWMQGLVKVYDKLNKISMRKTFFGKE